MARRHTRDALPPRSTLLDLAFAASFVVLVTAPLAITPVLADATAMPYDAALHTVGITVALGYVLGIAVLLRLQ